MDETMPRRNRWRRNGGLLIAGLLLLGVIGAMAQGGPGPAGGDRAMVRSAVGTGEAVADAPAGAATQANAAALSTGGSGGGADASQKSLAGTVGSGSTGASPASGATLPPGLGAPKVVKTATLAVEVKKGAFSSAFSKAASVAAANGGFVSSSTSSSSGEEDRRMASGQLVVRVPAEHFDAARQQLAGLGKVTEERIEGSDMSGTLADLGARLQNLTAQEEAIRLIMDKAKTIGETIQVQDQLSQVQEQIERLTAEQARLSDAVAFSTLTITVSEPGIAVGDEPNQPSPLAASFGRAVHGAEAVAGGLIVSLGYLLPLALLAGLGWLVVRSRRRVAAVA